MAQSYISLNSIGHKQPIKLQWEPVFNEICDIEARTPFGWYRIAVDIRSVLLIGASTDLVTVISPIGTLTIDGDCADLDSLDAYIGKAKVACQHHFHDLLRNCFE